MTTTQYIGARYVPLFADPLEWDNKREFEPLTIVLHNGASYTSRQYVPKGIDILNEEFWALTGNYNAQVEQYRSEVLTFDGRITTAQAAADKAQTTADNARKDVTDFEQTFNAKFPLKADDLAADSVTAEKIADGAITTAKLVAGSVTETKIADGAISTAKLALNSVTSLNIAPASVTNEKLGNDSVAEANLQDGSVTSSKFKTGAVNAAAIMDGAVTDAKLATGAITNDKLGANSVASGNIQDGAITATKISDTAINSILNGFTIRYFDSTDAKADNDGLKCPPGTAVTGSRLAGFYIVELQLLALNVCVVNSTEWAVNSSIVRLPSYVARPATSFLQLAKIGLIKYNSTNDFVAWTGLRYDKDGNLYPNSTIDASLSASIPSSMMLYLRPYSSGSEVTGNVYSAFTKQNGVI